MSTATEEKKGLTTQSIDELFTAAFALTHRIHAIDKLRTRHPKDSAERKQCEVDVAELREQRAMIIREVKRRAGEE